MSKKINFGTINTKSMDLISKYHVAYLELRSLRETYKVELGKLQEEEAKILENRKHDLEAGLPTDEVISKWSLEEVVSKMRKLKIQFDADCEPHNTAKREALTLISDSAYHSYVLSMNKGDLSSKGKLTLKKGKKTEEYMLEKSYKGIIADFLDSIGCKGQDNNTALEKFAQIMGVRTSGMVKCSKGNDYIKVKSATQYKELFMLAFLQYVINEKGVVTINNDGTLSMTEY